jgi:hypothetical protein
MERWIGKIPDEFASNPLLFFGSIATSCLLAALAIYLIFREYIIKQSNKNQNISEENVDYPAEEEYPDGTGSSGDFFENRADSYISADGETDTYFWQQTEQEMEVYVKLSGDLADAPKRSVQVQVRASSLQVAVGGVVAVQGQLAAEVLPGESNWQIDDTSGRGRCIWVTLFKKARTEPKNYWPGVFQHDIDLLNEGRGAIGPPPVHVVDPSDKESIKKAVKGLKSRS